MYIGDVLMNFELGFAKKKINIDIPKSNLLSCLEPNIIEYGFTGSDEVAHALARPIGCEKLSVLAKGCKDVVIITSDITRPVPSHIIIPHIISELEKAGIGDDKITIVFALGIHRGHTQDEKIKLVGKSVFSRIKCIDTDPLDCVNLGYTSRGTPVDIYSKVAQADFRICVGNIEYHYFAGYSGGYKAIMPGVSNHRAIQANHSNMVSENAKTGSIYGNPIREDIEEAGKLCGVDFIVNVVLDENKNIIKCVSGDAVKAHREGCAFLDTLYKVKISSKADIVIVSAGGFPKDINMYQAQKALDNAAHAVSDGGIIIWLASCKEGFGEKRFEEWMTTHEKSSDMIRHIREEFVLGGHKAASIAMTLEKAQIFLVSELDDIKVKNVFLTPFPDVNSALREAFTQKGKDAKVIVMPYGGSTLPVE